MFTISAYIALTAAGCLTFWMVAFRGTRNDTPPRSEPPAAQLRKAA